MKQFDFYEFTGILLPGALLLAGVVLIWPEAARVDGFKDLSLGGFGMFVLLAYVAGHLVHALGNLIEWIWWKAFGGMPTDWVRSGQHKLLADAQTIKLRELIIERLAISVPDKLSDLDARSWYAITRQIHAAVAAAGRATRVETFNGNYGLNRGLFSAVLAVAGLVLLSRTISEWAAGVLVLLAGLAAFRMHRFAKHYGRELFVQFLASFEFRVGKLGGRTGQGRPQAGRSRTLDAARQKTRWSEAESGGLTDSALETSDGGHGTAVRAGSGDRGPVGGQGSAV